MFSFSSPLVTFLLVFMGGGLGSVARYGLTLLLGNWKNYPWATLVANGAACLLLGFWMGCQLQQPDSTRRLLWMTGFCGGFSTFSTFTAETWSLWQAGQATAALLNVLVSLAVCFLCLILGAKLAT
jgi:fluoride exporter